MTKILLLLFLFFFTNANAKKIEHDSCNYYISPLGSDKNSGKNIKTPFKTLEQARDKIRENILPSNGVTICLREGLYKRTKSFELNQLLKMALP